MSSKDITRCVFTIILLMAIYTTNNNHPRESDLTLLVCSKNHNKERVIMNENFPLFTKDLPTSWIKRSPYFESEKQEYGQVKANYKVKGQVDLNTGQIKNDSQQFKDSRTVTIALLENLLATFWAIAFLGNSCFLYVYIFQLATSGSKDIFMINLAIVHILLTSERCLLLVLDAFKQEWKVGGASFTTIGFATKYLAVAGIFAITAVACGLHHFI